nr:type II toxin-antitoxin system ParD family antitoxin [Methylobacterium sp. GC_Met_2]
MPIRRTLTVSITPEQDALVRDCLQSGRFASASEVVRAALRLLEHDEVRLRQKPVPQRSNRSARASGLDQHR